MFNITNIRIIQYKIRFDKNIFIFFSPPELCLFIKYYFVYLWYVKLLNKTIMRKQIIGYLIAVCMLGIFQGLLMSFGARIGLSILVSILFWAGMLAPMLSSGK